jgi:hypothetical protein
VVIWWRSHGESVSGDSPRGRVLAVEMGDVLVNVDAVYFKIPVAVA